LIEDPNPARAPKHFLTGQRMMRKVIGFLGTAGLFALLSGPSHADEYPQFGKVFQSHSPDGQAYLVVLCVQADQCLEYAYRFCEGPYSPLDKSFLPASGFRFVCRGKPHKSKAPDTSMGPPTPSAEKPQG
jgi:hypothetical protein